MLVSNIGVFTTGILLGWGAAIPIGPINLEMMRRNLTYGTRFGMSLGVGACSADLTYVALLSIGALTLLNHASVLRIVGIVGALILAWFAWGALRAKPVDIATSTSHNETLAKTWLEGFLLTLINPFTILFWASVSSQVMEMTRAQPLAVFMACLGVIAGTFSWVCGYNAILHFTRHKLSSTIIRLLNITGGIILLGFSIYGLVRAL